MESNSVVDDSWCWSLARVEQLSDDEEEVVGRRSSDALLGDVCDSVVLQQAADGGSDEMRILRKASEVNSSSSFRAKTLASSALSVMALNFLA